MEYVLPPALLRHIQQDVLGVVPFAHPYVVLRKSSIPLTRIGHLEAFVCWVSGQINAPYEMISQREVIFYDDHGDEIGFCLQSGHFMTTWCVDANYTEGGETVAEALTRLDEDNISFALVTFYNRKGLQSVKVYKA